MHWISVLMTNVFFLGRMMVGENIYDTIYFLQIIGLYMYSIQLFQLKLSRRKGKRSNMSAN